LQLLSPTEKFCSRTIYAESYIDEIETFFAKRAAEESELDEYSDFKDARAGDRLSDHKSFVTELVEDSENGSQLFLNAEKGLTLLHLHNPSLLLEAICALVKQVESKVIQFDETISPVNVNIKELSQPIVKLRGEVSRRTAKYWSITSNLFGKEDDDFDGYCSGGKRVFRSFMEDEPKATQVFQCHNIFETINCIFFARINES
jgi:hypothetical protein